MKEPKIRFKEFKGEWEDHTLGDFGHISMCKRIFKNQTSPDGEIPFYKIGTFGYTPDAYISRKLYEEYRQLYPFPHKGDILISAAGTIGRTVEYMGEDAYYQDSNIVWLNHSNEIDNKFLKYLYSHTNWNNLEGATIKRLYNSILLSTKSNCPSLSEQQSIASFFTTIDAQISASTSRLASLKQIKAASLQSMFPQEGETTPRVRFKGFEGEWEKVSLGEETYPAGIKNYENLPLDSYSISNEFGFIPQNLQFENGGTMATADKRMYYIVSKNSFGYNPARINVGSLGYYSGNENVIVSSLYEIFKTSDRICDTFLLYWFKTSMFQKLIEQYQEGGVRFYFFYDKLCMCQIFVPSYEE